MIVHFSYSQKYGSQCKRVEMVHGKPVTVAYKPEDASEILSGEYEVKPRATVYMSKDNNFKIVVVTILDKIEILTIDDLVKPEQRTIPLGTMLEVEFAYNGHHWHGETKFEGYTFKVLPKQLPYLGPAPNGVRPRFMVRVSENLPKNFYQLESVRVDLVEEIKTKRGKRFSIPYQKISAVC